MGIHAFDPPVSSDTVEMFDTAYQEAKQGETVGGAVVKISRNGHYTIDVSGVLCQNPTFGLGATMMLVNRLITQTLTPPPSQACDLKEKKT